MLTTDTSYNIRGRWMWVDGTIVNEVVVVIKYNRQLVLILCPKH